MPSGGEGLIDKRIGDVMFVLVVGSGYLQL
jgi:hypothetical protein